MPVEPRYRGRYAGENDSVGNELVYFVYVEPVVSRLVQSATQRLTIATVVFMCIVYACPSLLTKCPKGIHPAKRVTTARKTNGTVIVAGAS